MIERYFDLSADEPVRLAHAIEASEDWDPVGMMEGEAIARHMLYSNLDVDQQRIYGLLREAGVL